MGKKEEKSSEKDEPLFRSFEFNFNQWNIGGKLIFISTVVAILSLLLPWIGGDAETEIGFMQGTSIFLALYIYPFFILAQDKSMSKIIGGISAGLGVIGPGAFLYYLSRDMMIRIPEVMDIGIVIYILASIVLFVGVIKYEKYDRYGKEKVLEKKKKRKMKKASRGKPCPECDSPMEYEREWKSWYCKECEKYRD